MHANLIAFSLFTVATPGPNNAMLVASGARHGQRRSLPRTLGV
jgi:threonine/homoserine/homoserine lactone efflux protein